MSAEAQALHDSATVVDLHVDTFLWTRLVGYDLGRRHRRLLPGRMPNPLGNHLDLPRMASGGLDAAIFGVVVRPGRGAWARARRALDHVAAQVHRHRDRLELARTAEGIRQARRRGRAAALLGVEGAHALEESPERVAELARRGVVYLGLVHLTSSAFGHPSSRPRRAGRGLTPAGHQLIDACEQAGVLVDLAHLNAAGVRDALARVRRPPIVSHTGLHLVHPCWRNVTGEVCRAVADRGGVVGVILYPPYLCGRLHCGVDRVVDHLAALRQAAGIEACALGSDLDGFILTLPDEIPDVSGLPRLTQRLLERGWSPEEIRAVLGGNVMRLLEQTGGPGVDPAGLDAGAAIEVAGAPARHTGQPTRVVP